MGPAEPDTGMPVCVSQQLIHTNGYSSYSRAEAYFGNTRRMDASLLLRRLLRVPLVSVHDFPTFSEDHPVDDRMGDLCRRMVSTLANSYISKVGLT